MRSASGGFEAGAGFGRALAVALVASLLVPAGLVGLAAGPVAALAPFSDVPDGHPFNDEISLLSGEIILGYPDGTFRPNAPVTRKALAAYLHRFWSWVGAAEATEDSTLSFVDVPGGHPFADDIAWMAANGFAHGYADGTFRPEEPVSRDAAAAFLYRFWVAARDAAAVDYPDANFGDVSPHHPFANEIGWMAATDVAGGYPGNVFRPNAVVSRQAAAAFLARIFEMVLNFPTSYSVNTPLDGNDAAPGDGVCERTYGVGDCSLRAAITEANLTQFEDEVSILPGVDPVLSIPGINEDRNATGDLDIRDKLTIHGAGAVVDGSGLDRVITQHLFADFQPELIIEDLTIQGGRVSPAETSLTRVAAGLSVGEETELFLERSVVRDNDATAAPAAASPVASGIWAEQGALVNSSIVVGNRGPGTGAAIVTGGMWLVESLVADNAGGGGVLVVGGGIAVADSTVRGHDGIGVNGNVGLIAGSAIVDNTFGVVTSSESPDVVNSTMTASGTAMTATGRLKVRSSTLVTTGPYPTLRVVGGVQPSVVASIVAGDHNTDHCDVPIGGTSGEWNIFTDDSCVLPGGENLSSTDPLLGPLADNGGPTPTYRPLPGSPAIDAIPFYWWQVCDEDLAVDQRGLPRPVGGACDIGAVELQPGE